MGPAGLSAGVKHHIVFKNRTECRVFPRNRLSHGRLRGRRKRERLWRATPQPRTMGRNFGSGVLHGPRNADEYAILSSRRILQRPAWILVGIPA